MSHIANYSLYRFSLPFKKPINFKGKELSTREGLWLVERKQHKITAISEISPLINFSQESLNACEQQLIEILKEPDFTVQKALKQPGLLASVHWGLYCLSQQLPVHHKKQSTLANIPLLTGSEREIIALYQDKGQPNLVKVKVARKSVQQDIKLLEKLLQLNPKLALRLDANQQWSKQQYLDFLQQAPKQAIDYIEEPTPCFETNLQLSAQFNSAIALDESLLSNPSLKAHPSIKALIIKPTLIGDPNQITGLLQQAQKQHWLVSVSSSFESPITLQQLSFFAQQWQKQYAIPICLGLDTLEAFSINAQQPLSQLINEAECLYSR